MKRILLILPAFFLLLSLQAQSQRTNVRALEPFDQLSVFGNLEVELIPGDTAQMIASSMEIDLSSINSRVEKNELIISMSKDLFGASKKVQVKVFYKKLKSISATGGASVVAEQVMKGDKMSFNAGTGGSIVLSLDLKTLEALVDEGSIITFDGNVDYQKVTAGSGGVYSAFELISDDAVVKAHTGGRIKVYAGQLLDATASTKAYIGYRGSPEKTNFNSSLGGEIKEDE